MNGVTPAPMAQFIDRRRQATAAKLSAPGTVKALSRGARSVGG